jgi:hypothetical protein
MEDPYLPLASRIGDVLHFEVVRLVAEVEMSTYDFQQRSWGIALHAVIAEYTLESLLEDEMFQIIPNESDQLSIPLGLPNWMVLL